MSVSVTDLAAFVGSSPGEVYRAYSVAQSLVDHMVGESTVPQDVLDEAYLEVGASVYRRGAEPSQAGAVQLMPDAPVPVRQPKDPRSVAGAILGPWIEAGFG